MVYWFLVLFGKIRPEASPPAGKDLPSLLGERARLAGTLACYRDFGFEAQAESCRIRLHRLAGRIREARAARSADDA